MGGASWNHRIWWGREASVMTTACRIMRSLRISPVPPINECFLRTYCAPGIVVDTGDDEQK